MSRLPFQHGGSRNFMAVPSLDNQRYVIVGAPIDGATTYRSGCRMGPNAIRDASMMLTDGVHERFSVQLDQWVGDAGDLALPAGNDEQAMKVITASCRDLSGRHVVTLGGHHGITYALLSALQESGRSPEIALVHFDAHCDTWNDHFGLVRGHGTWLRDAIEGNMIDPYHAISIGIRSPADEVTRGYLSGQGGTTISARGAMRHSPKLMADVIRAKVGDRPTYLSLDIDCLDPAFAPGTGTPEIGGLTTMWLCEVLENLWDVNWIGMDCVEVAPAYDHASITSLAAATLVWQYLSMIIHTNTKKIGT